MRAVQPGSNLMLPFLADLRSQQVTGRSNNVSLTVSQLPHAQQQASGLMKHASGIRPVKTHIQELC